LGSSVRFLGDVEDVAGLLAASDVAVLSSPSESRPHAVLEAAAAGLPIVATDIPGIREALGQHQHAHLAPVGDAERLAENLVQLISQPALRAELGELNRRSVDGGAALPVGQATADLIELA